MENLDDIIKKYTDALELMGQTYGGEIERKTVTPPKTENNETLEEGGSYSYKKENEEKEGKMPENEAENERISESVENVEKEAENETDEAVNTDPAVKPPSVNFPEGEATSFATFSASVFSGEGVYPVEGARVVVYREDNIYAFLETDENGTTKTVRLPAFEKENSLEPENPDRSIAYFADVFAEGFTSQKGLLVSSVGGSEILLRVLMVPEEERIG